MAKCMQKPYRTDKIKQMTQLKLSTTEILSMQLITRMFFETVIIENFVNVLKWERLRIRGKN